MEDERLNRDLDGIMKTLYWAREGHAIEGSDIIKVRIGKALLREIARRGLVELVDEDIFEIDYRTTEPDGEVLSEGTFTAFRD